MSKIKYRFNPRTLTYQAINRSAKKRLQQGMVYFLITIIAAIAFNVFFTKYFDTPKERQLTGENKALVFQYQMLSQKLQRIDKTLEHVGQRDDDLYRPIFELDPIPSQVRGAGFGGTNRYDELKKYVHADVMISTKRKLDQIRKELYIQSKSFDAVIAELKNKEHMTECIPAIQPISISDYGRISDYFGRRRDPFTGNIRMHCGMDFTGPIGTEIYVTGNGIVEKAGYSAYGYGKEVVVNHGYGYKSIYAHLHQINVNKGDSVTRGQVIGTLGNTGRSTGPHLHYEVRKHNKAVNPFYYYFNDLTAEQYDKMIAVSTQNRNPMD